MQANQIPAKFPIPFGANAGVGFIRPIPEASQISITPGAASLNDGFPPVCFQAVGAGGIPPAGQDLTGILNQATKWDQWLSIGGAAAIKYDPTQSAAIGGYPAGAILANASTIGLGWISLEDNNTSNPDTGGAGWAPVLMSQSEMDGRYLRIAPASEFYVNAATGNDSNPGTSTLPFATLQGAVNAISAYATVANVTVSVANGTYAGFTLGQSFVSSWTFIGNTSSPGSCVISSPTSATNGGYGVSLQNVICTFEGFAFSSYYENLTATRSQVYMSSCNLAGTSNAFSLSAYNTSFIVLTGAIQFSGNGLGLCQSVAGSGIQFGEDAGGVLISVTITISGTPAFSDASMSTLTCGVINLSSATTTFSGSATGSRYACQGNGVINTQGAGTSFLPGSTAGTLTSGGQYI